MLDAMNRIARFFDAEFADYDDDLPVLEAYAARTGGPILELGCGTGRALIPLAQAGYTVTGVELSPEMLHIARTKAAACRRDEADDADGGRLRRSGPGRAVPAGLHA